VIKHSELLDIFFENKGNNVMWNINMNKHEVMFLPSENSYTVETPFNVLQFHTFLHLTLHFLY
jgi:hypothetical protein